MIELCKERGDDFHREICEAINSVVRRELDSHVKKTSESGEEIEEFKPKKATRDYTDLVVNAYTHGCLSEIVTALCPCNKLYDSNCVLLTPRYDFIGHEIAAIFPEHNHDYSDWIRIYASEDLTVCLEFMGRSSCVALLGPAIRDDERFSGSRLRFVVLLSSRSPPIPPPWTTISARPCDWSTSFLTSRITCRHFLPPNSSASWGSETPTR